MFMYAKVLTIQCQIMSKIDVIDEKEHYIPFIPESYVCSYVLPGCQEGFNWFNGSCFSLKGTDGRKRWTGAKRECEKWGSTLGSIHSAEEEEFVRNGSTSKQSFASGKTYCSKNEVTEHLKLSGLETGKC